MRRFFYLLILLTGIPLLAAREGPVPLSGELRRSPIQLGVQFMTGYRSNYVFRGVELGEQAIEGQIASSIALSNDWALAGEVDFVHCFAAGNVSQTTLYSELQYYLADECTLGPSLGAQFYGGRTEFQSGCEPGFALRWNPVPEWSLAATGVYDGGQKGFYGNGAVTWQPLLTKSIAWENTVGVGISSDYLGASGFSDILLRSGLNIRLGPSLRLQPYTAITFRVGDRSGQTVCVGVWFSWVY